jgi:HEAT repeat protein
MRLIAIAALLLTLSQATAQDADKIGGKGLDEWIKDISDPDPSVRQIAIRTVVNFGPSAQRAVKDLQKAVSSTDASVRGDAAAALGMIQLNTDDLPKVGATLTTLLQDTQRPVRIQAASSLATMGITAVSANTIRYLSFMITDTTSWEVRKTAAYALGRLGLDTQKGPDALAMKALTDALRDPCAAVRLEAIMALSELGLSPRPAEVQAEVKALTYLQKDRDKAVAIWATVLLVFLDSNLLNSNNLQIMVNGLADPELRVRIQAARALGALGRPSVDGKPPKLPGLLVKVPQVMDGLRAAEGEMIMTVLSLLGPLGEDARPALPQVVQLTKDKELVVRYAAIRTLGTLGALAKEHIPLLINLLDDPDEQVKLSAIYALAGLGDLSQVALPDLRKLTASKEESVKQAAGMAIKAIEAARPKK